MNLALGALDLISERTADDVPAISVTLCFKFRDRFVVHVSGGRARASEFLRRAMPKFSIITTVLEPDQRLIESIRSVHHRADSEHIISVAGDFEKTQTLLKSAGITSPLLLAVPSASISEGFNACLRHASGEFIWVLNSGDKELDIDPLLRMIESNTDLDFVYGNVRYGSKFVRAKRTLNRRSCILHGMGFCHGAAVVKASFHDKYGLYDSKYRICMDAALFIKAVLSGAKSSHVDECVAYVAPGGISGQARTRVGELYRIISQHVVQPIPLMVAAKWLIASWFMESLHSSHDD